MIPRLGDGNLAGMRTSSVMVRLENDSPSRGRKPYQWKRRTGTQLSLENDSPSRGRKLKVNYVPEPKAEFRK